MVAGAPMALFTRSSPSTLRADQIVGGTAINFLALGITGYVFVEIYGDQGTPAGVSEIPRLNLGFLDVSIPIDRRLPRGVFGRLNR